MLKVLTLIKFVNNVRLESVAVKEPAAKRLYNLSRRAITSVIDFLMSTFLDWS